MIQNFGSLRRIQLFFDQKIQYFFRQVSLRMLHTWWRKPKQRKPRITIRQETGPHKWKIHLACQRGCWFFFFWTLTCSSAHVLSLKGETYVPASRMSPLGKTLQMASSFFFFYCVSMSNKRFHFPLRTSQLSYPQPSWLEQPHCIKKRLTALKLDRRFFLTPSYTKAITAGSKPTLPHSMV